MNKIFFALALAALASAARAQSEALAFGARAFEAQAEAAILPMAPVDAFAGVGECRALDIKTIRPYTLEEASELANPCLKAVGAKYSASLKLEAGLLAVAAEGRPMKPGLILKTDIVPGTKVHRDLASSLERRGGRILGHRVRLLTRGETAPAPVSAVQDALKQCLMTTVVRDIRTGADFVKIYGSCLTRNPDLMIGELRPGAGLTVEIKTRADARSIAALNGLVTVNAGKGPVTFMIIAESAPARP